MDRLICGDVGFGKTEVALRAAFAAAINGKQVAVVVPTTLLARQHFTNFAQRFAGLPIKVAQLSRMVRPADSRPPRPASPTGEVDIVVGTHALLGKGVDFKDLGLVIVDEEQHFGVKHKERLKELRAEVHVLTLSATPIPRTLQLAMTGVRDLSIIATPPVDRLAVRTFVTPFDELLVREALLRERYRGGQSFYVCPRIEDLDEARRSCASSVPEAKFVVAHGQMAPTELEDACRPSTRASTTCCCRRRSSNPASTSRRQHADRASRRHVRPGAALPAARPRRPLEDARLRAVHHAREQAADRAGREAPEGAASLDTLGAGFQLASHDLDIRGAGNLLGDEQSGHIKEVGFELYQQMLQDAIEALKARQRGAGGGGLVAADHDRRARDDPGRLRAGPAAAPRPLPPPVDAGDRRRDRELRGRADRPLRPDARRRSTS